MTTITREIINPNFYHVTENMDYATLCKRINKFKHLFLSKGLKKGDNIGIGTLTGNTNMIAGHFAAWELGLSFKNLYSKRTIRYYLGILTFYMNVVLKNFTSLMNIAILV